MILDFNRDWQFKKEGGEWLDVRLPHDAMLTEPRDAACRNGVNSGYFPGGRYIYQKTFMLTTQDLNKSIVLHFEGVYRNCSVTVNEKQVASNRYGYTPFDADISNAVYEGENTVVVCVDNALEPNCRWYSGSGIYRNVWLELRAKTHMKAVHIETKSIDPPIIAVSVDSEEAVFVEIYDEERMVASGKPGELTIPEAMLWSAETPKLYTCVAKTTCDERRVNFGIRKLAWSAKKGLTINGERVLLRGGCIHHDHGVLGACEYPDAEERRIRILKENGFNAVRIAHNPASQIMLDTCDRLGMYVMNEAFDGWYTPKTYHDYSRWFQADWKSDLEAMVRSSRNHPSVILYSTGNEVTETAEDRGVRLCAEMAAYVRSLDATRPVTAGINVLLNVYIKLGLGVYRDKGDYRPEPLPPKGKYREKKTGSAFFNALTSKLGKQMFFASGGKKGDRACYGAAQGLDILGLNYASSRYDPDAKRYPDRLMVGAETMVADLPYNWERVKRYPQLIGDFVWSAWDYLGEACMGDWTYHSYKGLPLLAGQGMIDITGKPLASMYFMQVVWGLRKTPFIGVRPLNHAHERPSTGAWQFTNAIDSWRWRGFEGERAVVEVYSPGAFVRLSLNGKILGTKKLKDFRTSFSVGYAPGQLRAEALDVSGNVLSSHQLDSGGCETHLTLRADKRTLAAGSGELCYVEIEFTDENGQLLPHIEQRVDLEVTGAATLLGFGSALCKTDEVFDKSYHNAYRGRALAVLQAGDEPGMAEIVAKATGVTPVGLKIAIRDGAETATAHNLQLPC